MKVSIRMHRLADGLEVVRCREAICGYCTERRVALRCRLRPDVVLVFDREVETEGPLPGREQEDPGGMRG